MTALALLLILAGGGQWWILVQDNDSRALSVPRAAGPYPSKTLCRLAGKALMPSDSRFWTEAEKAEAAQRAELRARIFRAAIKTAWEKAKHKAGSVEVDGATYTFDARGWVSAEWGMSSGQSFGNPPPTAITGCVWVQPS